MKRSQICDTLQICPHQDSNSMIVICGPTHYQLDHIITISRSGIESRYYLDLSDTSLVSHLVGNMWRPPGRGIRFRPIPGFVGFVSLQGSHTSWKTRNNNKFIFQILKMSLNLTKSGNVLENIAWEKIHMDQKSLWINIMPVENFNCRRKRVTIHGLDIPC